MIGTSFSIACSSPPLHCLNSALTWLWDASLAVIGSVFYHFNVGSDFVLVEKKQRPLSICPPCCAV